jgi:peptide/nickel transport system substrate-binding protein
MTFSDGTSLDAAAVTYNSDRNLDPKTTSSYEKSLLVPSRARPTPWSARPPFVLDAFTKGCGSRFSRRAAYDWAPGYAVHTGPAHLDAIVFR